MNYDYIIHLCENLLPIFPKKPGIVKFQKKESGSPVTQTDLAVDQYLFDTLTNRGFKPEQIICEERPSTSFNGVDDEGIWIIDPLDGTREFIQGLPEYAVSIAFRKQGKFTAAVIFNPALPHCAIWDETGLHTPTIYNNAELPFSSSHVLLCSRSEWTRGLLDKLKFPLPIVPLGSVAYKLALVATGQAKATISFQPKHSWDIAAGIAMIEGNGGKVTDLRGRSFDFSEPLKLFEDGLLATHSHADHSELLSYASKLF